MQARKSNLRHRPIGIGVQGLADAFMLMRYAFDSEEAAELNRRIFECMYFASLDASCELAAQLGPYETYAGSPISKGILQTDMWGVDTEELTKVSGLDWKGLRERIKRWTSPPCPLTILFFWGGVKSSIFDVEIVKHQFFMMLASIQSRS